LEDVRQEVFVALKRGIENFRQNEKPGAFRRWLHGITQNRLLMHWRTAEGLPLTLENEVLAAIVAKTKPCLDETSEELAILYRRSLDLVREEFEEHTWQAFWRVVIENREPALVAEGLKVTTNVIYIAKARVLARLREEFVELIEG
jgi:RNA polymerase sigma-70 factor (ECF subfamily)